MITRKECGKRALYKIIFYINTLGAGGAERVISNLASEFAENGHVVSLITSFKTKNEYILNPKVDRFSLEESEIRQSRLEKNMSRIQKLRKFCKTKKPDVLISFMAEPNFRAVVASLGLPIKTIISVRNDPDKEYASRLFRVVGKCILPFADGCVFQTEDARRWFPRKLQKKGTIIFNAVQSKFYEVVRVPKEHLVITCGRLEPQKNHKILIEAFYDVVKMYPKARLRIYGTGNLKSELEKIIKEYSLTKYIRLVGVTADVPSVLAEADIFILSSDFEGMPNALMEAMAVGLPCISTDCPCGGSRMLIRHGDSGELVLPGNRVQLANAIKRVLGNEKLKQKYAANTRLVAYQFTTQKIYSQWEKYIEDIVAK